MGHDDADLLVIADDLSGAAEAAATLVAGSGSHGVPVHLLSEGNRSPALDRSLPAVIDSNSRYAPAPLLVEVFEPVLQLVAERRIVIKKIDSLLRGNVAAELALLLGSGRRLVVSPALPSSGRVVRRGRVLVHGTPLDRTSTWAIESATAPGAIHESLPGVSTRLVTLDVVRGDIGPLRVAMHDPRGAAVIVCDAETDEDLARIAEAALLGADALPILVGSSAMTAAVGRLLLPAAPPVAAPGSGSAAADKVAFVVGTREPSAQRQIAELQGAEVTRLDPAALIEGRGRAAAVASVASALRSTVAVVAIDDSVTVQPSQGQALIDALASAVTEALAGSEGTALVVTGGQSARAMLDAMGTRVLTVHRAVDGDAALGTTDSGITVVTRPGSFGGDGGFVRILDALMTTTDGGRPAAATHQPHRGSREAAAMTTTSDDQVGTDHLPILAVTMGDAAGVGPEITVAALLDPVVLARSRPIAIGDARRLRQAADVLGLSPEIVSIESVADARFAPGRVNVIDLGLLPEDLPWGVLSAVAGDAAFHYIRVASELAMAGDVDAICTAPLNKEALHSAGHMYPGHTEMLASLTGTAEVSMLLSTPKIKVIHVTTHIGLIDAIAKIEPGLVERTVRRGISAMQGSGIADPKVGVCAINPHAGENGLFGYGEEEEKIAPAIRKLQAEGLDVHGPLPADTAFFLGGRGDYDLIVAMYHDQGHGPVKVLGIEAGTNVTVGLPVIRTSVDHGTAFDIAGKGTVDVRSMVEALRQAAELSQARAAAA